MLTSVKQIMENYAFLKPGRLCEEQCFTVVINLGGNWWSIFIMEEVAYGFQI